MQNRDFFIQKVNEGAEIRSELNKKHHKHLGKLALLFNYAFEYSTHTFKYLNDIVYYKGGWPKENTPPRLETLIKHVSSVIQFFTLAGKTEELNEYCEKYGIEITIKKPFDCFNNNKLHDGFKFNKLLKKLYPDIKLESKKEIINFLFDEGNDVQEIICKLADEIKLENAKMVQAKCNIKKKHYVNIVNIKAGNIDSPQSTKVNKRIDNIKNDVTQLTQAISIFPE